MSDTIDNLGPINFNQPYLSGKELHYINDAVSRNQLSGNGHYSKVCQQFFETQFGFYKCLLTTSCTDALEMCALLLNIEKGDEVIMPSFTFVSTANAFALRGAKIVFVDSEKDHPNMDAELVRKAITSKTKAIVAVHYAGVACDMLKLKLISEEYKLFLIEDAAQAINVPFNNKYLGGIGDLAAFSFHETKNIQCGEGGMLVINNNLFAERAEVIWEKGTNRQAFFRGQVDKYRWVDLGSSFLPSELNAAYLWAQLEQLESITTRRKELWKIYYDELLPLANDGFFSVQTLENAGNGHLFYIMLPTLEQRQKLIEHLQYLKIMAVFHYQALHLSPFYLSTNPALQKLPNAENFELKLLRLPLFMDLTYADQKRVINGIESFFNK